MMENQSSKFVEVLDEITQALNCNVLKKHVSMAFKEAVDFEMTNLTPHQIGMQFAENLKPLNIYKSLPDGFWGAHKIAHDSQESIITELNYQATQYCLYSIYPDITPDIIAEIKRLKKVSAASKKLRQLLPSPEDGLFAALKTIVNIEVHDLNSQKFDIFFSRLNRDLETLEKLYSEIPQTAFGQMTKIGSKSPQGNLALRIWILLTNLIWTETLGRSFDYDGPHGVSGPARFTNFAFEALLPLHLEIEHHQVEYAVRAFREQPQTTHAALRPKKPLSPS